MNPIIEYLTTDPRAGLECVLIAAAAVAGLWRVLRKIDQLDRLITTGGERETEHHEQTQERLRQIDARLHDYSVTARENAERLTRVEADARAARGRT